MDIKQATSIARSMVTEWGMSPALSNVYYGGEQEVFIGRDYQTQASYSDEIAALIDSEIRKIVDTAYDRAYKILSENTSVLHAMVELLYEHETIYGDEVDMLIDGKTPEEVTAYINEKKAKLAKEAKAREEALRPAPVLGNSSEIIVKEPDAAKADEAEKTEETATPETVAETEEETSVPPVETEAAPETDERGNDEPADKSDKEDKKDE